MKRYFTSFMQSWWQPLLCYFVSVCSFVFVSWYGYDSAVPIFRFFCIIFLLLLLSSGVFLIWNKKWLRSILPLGVFMLSIVTVLFFFAAAFILKGIVDGDGFAKGLTIPNDIEISEPEKLIDENIPTDSLPDVQKAYADFQLYSSFQPGLYEYAFWVRRIEKGKIYLKVFEITKETALSTDRLQTTTSIEVFNPTDNLVRFSTENYFTIYEGDWGNPYAARFEVWFIPVDGSAHRQLFTKNYKIEGWMH